MEYTMKSDIEKLMHDYAVRYPQVIRDVVETFSSGTTRLGNTPAMPAMSVAGVKAIAVQHNINAETLISAVVDYAAIEALSEQALRKRNAPSPKDSE